MVRSSSATFLYAFFEPQTQWTRRAPKNVPGKSAQLFDKINQFDQKLLLIGILPNQLRTLAREHKMEDIEASLDSLRGTLFWDGYEIWKKRKLLVSRFWKLTAPSEWKVGFKEKKLRHKRKLRITCKNPFHYCEKLEDLSRLRRTPCACSDVKKKASCVILPDIRCFITKYPKRISSISGFHLLDRKDNFLSNNRETACREDLIRQQHDRGKRKRSDCFYGSGAD